MQDLAGCEKQQLSLVKKELLSARKDRQELSAKVAKLTEIVGLQATLFQQLILMPHKAQNAQQDLDVQQDLDAQQNLDAQQDSDAQQDLDLWDKIADAISTDHGFKF